jgi:hypothetical protein
MWGAPGGPFLDAILPETSHEHPATTLTINLTITWAVPRKSSSSCFGFWVLGIGVPGTGFRVVVLGVECSWFWGWGSAFRVLSSGCMLQGAGFRV